MRRLVVTHILVASLRLRCLLGVRFSEHLAEDDYRTEHLFSGQGKAVTVDTLVEFLEVKAEPTNEAYVKSDGGKNCPLGRMVRTKEECENLAGPAVGHPFIKQIPAENPHQRPAGCFWDKNGGSYFNPDLNAKPSDWGGVGGICKAAYYKAEGAANCPLEQIVDTKEECVKAGLALGHPLIVSGGVKDHPGRPAGCFWDQNGQGYFNTDLTAIPASNSADVGGICKTLYDCDGPGKCKSDAAQGTLCLSYESDNHGRSRCTKLGAKTPTAPVTTPKALEDNDYCLQQSPGWGSSYVCSTETKYCDTYAKDMHRCCPLSCGRTAELTETECTALTASGTCLYPPPTQVICSDGTPTNELCSVYANDLKVCDVSKTCCEVGKESSGRRRDWGGDAYDNCKMTCGICEVPKPCSLEAPTGPCSAPNHACNQGVCEAYVRAEGGKNCPPEQMVRTKDECEHVASLALGYKFIKEIPSENPLKRPAGCFWDQGQGGTSYFNPTLTAIPADWGGVGGICKVPKPCSTAAPTGPCSALGHVCNQGVCEAYVKAEGGKNCPPGRMVSTKEECEHVASLALGYKFVKEIPAENPHQRPAGCFWDKGAGGTSYFNPTLTAIPADWGGVGGICKAIESGVMTNWDDCVDKSAFVAPDKTMGLQKYVLTRADAEVLKTAMEAGQVTWPAELIDKWSPAGTVDKAFMEKYGRAFFKNDECKNDFNRHWLQSWKANFKNRSPQALSDLEKYLDSPDKTSNDFQLFSLLVLAPKLANFGSHIHASIEYVYVIAGELQEVRIVDCDTGSDAVLHFTPEQRTRGKDAAVPYPDGKCTRYFELGPGHPEINGIGSSHMSKAGSDGLAILALFSGLESHMHLNQPINWSSRTFS